MSLSYFSVWSRSANTATLDSNSSGYISYWRANSLANAAIVLTSGAVATTVSSLADREYSVPMTVHRGSLDATVRIPLGTLPDPSNDGHLSIYDPITNRIHDLWQAKYSAVTDTWTCGTGASSTPIGDGLPLPFGLGLPGNNNIEAGTNGANFPLQAGLLTPEDISQGQINHALVFGTPNIGVGKVFPATGGTNSSGDANMFPYGTWLRLDPTIDITTYPLKSWEFVIGKALQDYGMFLRDQTTTTVIYGENTINRGGPLLWTNVGMNPGISNNVSFSAQFPWDKLQVLQAPVAS